MMFGQKNVVIDNCLVVDTLPNSLFKVKTPYGCIICTDASGKPHQSFISILPGDIVTVEVSPYDESRGRITQRKK